MRGRIVIGAVVPAAGLSSRMGAFKPLMPFGSGTVIEATVQSVEAYADTVTVVLGKRADELRVLLDQRFGDRLIITENPDYSSTDMFTSVKIGLRSLDPCDAFFIVPADMPLISASVFKTLIDAFDGGEALLPTVGGRRGHPPLISSSLIPDILAYGGEGGLRGFFEGCEVREIPVEDNGALTDLDTPEDYKKIMNGNNSYDLQQL